MVVLGLAQANLQHFHGILLNNQTVTDYNRDTVVEVLRSIAELIIWCGPLPGSVRAACPCAGESAPTEAPPPVQG